MIQYIIIADSKPVALSLKKVVSVLFTVDNSCVHVKTLNPIFQNLHERLNAYIEVAEWVESVLSSGQGLNKRIVACVSAKVMSVSDMDPMRNPRWSDGRASAASVIGMLILSFPEVEWVLGNGMQMPLKDVVPMPLIGSKESVDYAMPAGYRTSFSSPTLFQAVELMRSGYSPLFDGDGLREVLYSVIKGRIKNEISYLPCRSHLAMAIDDEISYAYFNAYASYRFGFRGYAVSTLKLMELLLNGDMQRIPTLAVEDLYLNFADRDPKKHISLLEERDKRYEPLKKTSLRIIASSGGGTPEEIKKWSTNEKYLNLQFESRWVKIPKPFSGVFDLYEQGKFSVLIENAKKEKSWNFNWPPEEGDSAARMNNNGGHSCVGVLLAISERLIGRARRLQSDASCAVSAVHGAVLSVTACELLGCKTPTIALEALALKHYFEVLAECQFYGIQSTVDVGKRLADLEMEIDVIGKCFEESHRELAVLNGKAAIVDMLVQLYREQNQFDEEQRCLDKARALHQLIRRAEMNVKYPILMRFCNYRSQKTEEDNHQKREDEAKHKVARLSLSMNKRGLMFLAFCYRPFVNFFLSVIKWVVVMTFRGNGFLTYLNFCLRALTNFLKVVAMWMVILTFFCLILKTGTPYSGTWTGLFRSGAEAAALFFGANPLSEVKSIPEALVSGLGVTLGFLHMGIFISYIYSIISRK